VSNSKAQCPDSTWSFPPDTAAWTQDSTYQQIPGTSCSEWIFYCRRDDINGDTEQIWVNRIAIDSSTDCDSIDFATAIIAAQSLVYNDPLVNFSYPCSKVGHPFIIESFIGLCWEYFPMFDPFTFTLQWMLIPCGISWCEEKCQVCEDPITLEVHITNCSWETSGSPGCTQSPPAYPARWQELTCYNLGCGSTRETMSGHDAPKVSDVRSSFIINKSVTLIPNPAQDEVECAWSGSAKEVELIDVLGNIVHAYTASSTPSDIHIPLKGLAFGSYYIRIAFTDGSIQTYPLAKSRR
jgi:hypothetical protein